MSNVNYSADDEHGNQITAGLASYDAALQVARKYISAHRTDGAACKIYEDRENGESWDIAAADV